MAPLTYEIDSKEVEFGEKIAEGSSGRVCYCCGCSEDLP